jgi:transposase-like protein
MVYKQNNLLWSGGQKGSPVFLGPAYIHWKGNYENYFEFFAALKRDLFDQELAGTQMDPTFLNFGSDQEKAVLKALNALFPECPKLLCVRHLMQNLVDHLKDKIGLPSKDRMKVANDVMKLCDVDSVEEFDAEANRLEAELQGLYPSFGRYFSDFTDALKKYCMIPHLSGYHDSVDYTTNANESMNIQAKFRTGWKPQSLPDLVSMIKK